MGRHLGQLLPPRPFNLSLPLSLCLPIPIDRLPTLLVPGMHSPGALPKLNAPFLLLLLTPNPVPLLVKVLVHVLRRNPPAAARHGRRQPPVPRAGKHAAEPLDGLVVALEDDLRPVCVVVVVVAVAVLDRVGVEVGALRDGLEEDGCFGLSGGGGVGWGCGSRGGLRDQGQLDRVKVVVACAARGQLELQIDGGKGLVGGAEGFERVDADLLVGDRDAAFGRGAEDGQVAVEETGVSAGIMDTGLSGG